jgi:mannose-6-phosphate isomerase-like protein (cupin superfamily)
MRPNGRAAAFTAVSLAVLAMTGCAQSADRPAGSAAPARSAPLPPPPIVTYQAGAGAERVEHGERIVDVDEARKALHAQHHPHGVLETRRLPGSAQPPAMKSLEDFALPKEKLVVINPGPGEFVHVMEGQRHGYRNLTVGITYTAPGGAPPMHTHAGEEAHVLLEGEILYALGDELFTISAPYIVNIPPMVPHSFVNVGDALAELVVIFPANVWEYDVLDHFPFKDVETAKRRARKIGEAPALRRPTDSDAARGPR